MFRVSSPGGSVVASDQILAALRTAQERGKQVVVSMGDVAASGGYYVSAYADEIVASPTTITGSIGVVGGKLIIGPAMDHYLSTQHRDDHGRLAAGDDVHQRNAASTRPNAPRSRASSTALTRSSSASSPRDAR